jgi:hypothetical protein
MSAKAGFVFLVEKITDAFFAKSITVALGVPSLQRRGVIHCGVPFHIHRQAINLACS